MSYQQTLYKVLKNVVNPKILKKKNLSKLTKTHRNNNKKVNHILVLDFLIKNLNIFSCQVVIFFVIFNNISLMNSLYRLPFDNNELLFLNLVFVLSACVCTNIL